jgi:hypothetical protein
LSGRIASGEWCTFKKKICRVECRSHGPCTHPLALAPTSHHCRDDADARPSAKNARPNTKNARSFQHRRLRMAIAIEPRVPEAKKDGLEQKVERVGLRCGPLRTCHSKRRQCRRVALAAHHAPASTARSSSASVKPRDCSTRFIDSAVRKCVGDASTNLRHSWEVAQASPLSTTSNASAGGS